MSIKPADPLLAAAKIVIIIAQTLTIVGLAALGIGIGAVLTVGRAKLVAELGAAGSSPLFIGLIIGAMAVGMILLALAWRFFKELRGIVDTVGAGDPFLPENADRLSRMGWIAVAAQLLMLPLAGLAAAAVPYMDKSETHFRVDGGFDGGSLLLTLVLFILARVFREGTRMRDDLEGTV